MTDFPSPIVTVDVVLLTLRNDQLHCLLTKRTAEPFEHAWALPGGYVHPTEDENLEDSAARVLLKKAGVQSHYLEQLQTFSGARRDPRGWSLSVAYFALVPSLELKPSSAQSRWFPVRDVEALPFDHDEILAAAVARVRSKALYTALPVHFIPDVFTLSELQSVYQSVLQTPIDKRSFRRRMTELGVVEPVDGMFRSSGGSPAQVYRKRQGVVNEQGLLAKSLPLHSATHGD